MFQTVDAAQLKALLEGDDRPLVLDVRSAGEFARGTIAGAQHAERERCQRKSTPLIPVQRWF
jgi:rhodanese-related sulfurtransferase